MEKLYFPHLVFNCSHLLPFTQTWMMASFIFRTVCIFYFAGNLLYCTSPRTKKNRQTPPSLGLGVFVKEIILKHFIYGAITRQAATRRELSMRIP